LRRVGRKFEGSVAQMHKRSITETIRRIRGTTEPVDLRVHSTQSFKGGGGPCTCKYDTARMCGETKKKIERWGLVEGGNVAQTQSLK